MGACSSDRSRSLPLQRECLPSTRYGHSPRVRLGSTAAIRWALLLLPAAASVVAFDPRDARRPERLGQRRLEFERLPTSEWI